MRYLSLILILLMLSCSVRVAIVRYEYPLPENIGYPQGYYTEHGTLFIELHGPMGKHQMQKIIDHLDETIHTNYWIKDIRIIR